MEHPSYTLLYVDDPAASARFYAALLDAAPVEASPTFALFALRSGLMLGLWSRHTVEPAPPPAAGAGAAELGFRVAADADVEAAHAAWQAQGVRIVQPPVRLDFGYAFLAQDPDGHRLRVYALGQPDAA
ncbi:VOC family protein [Pseudorhodoferax sp.]|uniref:VOC family protein n=1 Tax=Pseudorhodoferax sp. TaxID=1993553 RepID=UPI0039E4ED88